MRSTIGLENMTPDHLYDWLRAYRDDLRHCADYPAIGWKAHDWALTTCTRIVLILARKSYDPRTKKPPRNLVSIAAARSETFDQSRETTHP